MITDTIAQIEARLNSAEALPDAHRAELLRLLALLRSEIAALGPADANQAQSIAQFTTLSTHEALREDRKPALLEASLSGLAASIDGFETSHPRLVQIVNALSQSLSSLGV